MVVKTLVVMDFNDNYDKDNGVDDMMMTERITTFPLRGGRASVRGKER